LLVSIWFFVDKAQIQLRRLSCGHKTWKVCRLCRVLSHALSWTKFHYSDTDGFVTDFVTTPSRHVEIVRVHNFHGPRPQLSPKLHGFMVCVCDFIGESWHNRIWALISAAVNVMWSF